jgi:hypothetical protein
MDGGLDEDEEDQDEDWNECSNCGGDLRVRHQAISNGRYICLDLEPPAPAEDDRCDCSCHVGADKGPVFIKGIGRWCCYPCDVRGPVTEDDLRALHDRVQAMAMTLRAEAERSHAAMAWNAWRNLNSSLYDIHGAASAVGMAPPPPRVPVS